MLVTHIHCNGLCREAIELYKKAFQADVKTIIYRPGRGNLVDHAEITIHDQLLMLNDYAENDHVSKSAGYQLAVRFDNETDLLAAYSVLNEGSTTVFPMQATDYSACVVRLIDRYDVRWALWV